MVATGQRPDLDMTRELRLDLDPWLESPKALGPAIDPNLHSCGSVPPHGYQGIVAPRTRLLRRWRQKLRTRADLPDGHRLRTSAVRRGVHRWRPRCRQRRAASVARNRRLLDKFGAAKREIPTAAVVLLLCSRRVLCRRRKGESEGAPAAAERNRNPKLKRPPWPGANAVADRTYNVLFLCTGNSARSIIAEAILNKVGAGTLPRVERWKPAQGPSESAYAGAAERLGLRHVTGFRSKSWDEFAKPGAPKFDFIFTVCDNAAGEACPVWPGNPMTAHWGIPDPAEATGTEAQIGQAFSDAYRMLNQRIGIFTALPIASLDALTLQSRLREIGRSQGATAKAEAQVTGDLVTARHGGGARHGDCCWPRWSAPESWRSGWPAETLLLRCLGNTHRRPARSLWC